MSPLRQLLCLTVAIALLAGLARQQVTWAQDDTEDPRQVRPTKEPAAPLMLQVSKTTDAVVHVTLAVVAEGHEPGLTGMGWRGTTADAVHLLHTSLKTGQMQALVHSGGWCDMARRQRCGATRLLGYVSDDSRVFALVWTGKSMDRPPVPDLTHRSDEFRTGQTVELVAFDLRTGSRIAATELSKEVTDTLPRAMQRGVIDKLAIEDHHVQVGSYTFKLTDTTWTIVPMAE